VIKSYELIGLKKKRLGMKKPYEELKVGDDFHHDTGQWNRLERIIDRDNDHYYEHIEDAAGNELRHVEERLSEHRGRGSAKHAKKPRH
jgi:hypothetical protein